MAKEDLTPNQESVIKLTSENLRKGKRIIKGEILKKSGYAESTTLRPKAIYESDGVREGLKPITDRLKAEIEKIQTEMESRNITKEKYKELGEVQDKKIKNFQLLSGEATERIEETIVSEEELKAYNEYRKTKRK